MGSNSRRKSASSGRSTPRKRVVIGASETMRVRYNKGEPEVHTERKEPRKRNAGEERQRSSQARAFARTKKEEREHRQRTARIRTTALWVALAVLVVGAVVGLVAVYRSQAFAVSNVQVDGNSRLTRDQILRGAAVPGDATLLRVDTNTIAGAIERSPWIADAEVERDFPSTLRITVVEREPGAVVAIGKKRWVIATDGTWIMQVRQVGDVTPKPVFVTGIPNLAARTGTRTDSRQLVNALRVIEGLSPELRGIVRAVVAPEIDRTALLTTGDIEIIVGRADDMAKKDEIVRRILAEQRGKVVYINVRTTDRPTWRGLEEQP
ncbi:MAG: FtsQ-type POTRA domain-containing protein [Coriobacteriales bacterium]|nr:FtsQ-type POTRA domain-containing protein [Coriobacteriales bacterium]